MSNTHLQAQSVEAGSAPKTAFVSPFLFLALAVLAQMPNIKIAGVQLAEIGAFLLIAERLLVWSARGWRGTKTLETTQFLRKVLVLMGCLVPVTIIANLTARFSPPTMMTGILYQPYFLSAFKLTEFSLVLFVFVYAVHVFTTNIAELCRFFVVYSLFASAVAVYAIVAYVLTSMFNLDIGGAMNNSFGDVRATGLFLEGGPYGAFLITSMLSTIVLFTSFRRITSGVMCLLLSVQFAALLLAESKASMVAITAMLLISAFVGGRKLVTSFLILLCGVAVAAIIMQTYVATKIEGYLAAMSEVEAIAFDRDIMYAEINTSFYYGRIPAAIIFPRMIADRPFVGVGLGNYSITRNAAPYRGRLPLADVWDLPGWGLLGYIAELGIPVWLLLVWLCAAPIARAHEAKAVMVVKLLSLCPLMIFFSGTQITFIYPWLTGAAAIALVSVSTPLSRRDENDPRR